MTKVVGTQVNSVIFRVIYCTIKHLTQALLVVIAWMSFLAEPYCIGSCIKTIPIKIQDFTVQATSPQRSYRFSPPPLLQPLRAEVTM
jgi:hypothetical protein